MVSHIPIALLRTNSDALRSHASRQQPTESTAELPIRIAPRQEGSLEVIDGSFKRAFHRYPNPAVLAADEFGYEAFDTKLAAYLFRLVSARYGHDSIVLTANTGFSTRASFFPFQAPPVATVYRLIDRAITIRFTGQSFRQPRDIYGAPLDE